MDYIELIENLKNMLPEKILYSDLICAEGAYAHSGPLVYEDPEPYFIEQAITAITELIARVEDAENDEQGEKRATWIWKESDKEFECSRCHGRCLLNYYESDWHKLDFCPHCGADMRPEKRWINIHG